MSTNTSISCESLQVLTSSTSCFSNDAGKCRPLLNSGAECCNIFHDRCNYDCRYFEPTGLPAAEELWDKCIPYYRVEPHIQRLSKDERTVSLVQSPLHLEATWNDTAFATCLIELSHQSSTWTNRSDGGLKCSRQTLISDGGILSLTAAHECKAELCADKIIDPDIAGIGIYISYILQISIFLTLLLLWIPLQIYIRLAGLSSGGSFWSDSPKSKVPSKNVEWTTMAAKAIVKLSISFHKAQCFFALALAGTSWHFMTTTTDSLKDVDQRALTTIVGSGIYPVTCMLLFLVLRHPGRLSLMMIIVSVVTWFLSMLVSYSVIGTAVKYESEQYPVPACGGTSLSDFCHKTELNYPRSLYFITIPIIVIAVALALSRRARTLFKLVLFLIIDRDTSPKEPAETQATTNTAITHKSCSQRKFGPWTQRHVHSPILLVRVVTRLWVILVLLTSVAAVVSTGLLLIALPPILFIFWFKQLTNGFKDHLSQTWTFGQIVAVMIWLPTVAEAVESCWNGVLYLCPSLRTWLPSEHNESGSLDSTGGSDGNLLPVHIGDCQPGGMVTSDVSATSSAETTSVEVATTSTLTEAVPDTGATTTSAIPNEPPSLPPAATQLETGHAN